MSDTDKLINRCATARDWHLFRVQRSIVLSNLPDHTGRITATIRPARFNHRPEHQNPSRLKISELKPTGHRHEVQRYAHEFFDGSTQLSEPPQTFVSKRLFRQQVEMERP